MAEELANQNTDFAYANLAVRGRLLQQIVDEQIEPALKLRPDLITISAGGNDVIRPGTDPDRISIRFEDAVRRLRADNATVVVFTGVDVGFSPVFNRIRGKVAIYNENIREIAQAHDCVVADMWSLRALQDSAMWALDRLHPNTLGHHTIARMVLDVLNVPNGLEPLKPEPLPQVSWRRARAEDFTWAKEYLVPWVLRRIRHQSSGDHVLPKRPDAAPVSRLVPELGPKSVARSAADEPESASEG